ncbi:hypothetical protein [Spiroplasma endosymbiont of Labia minor]|uniref:hypothetical protein n=1 Tax=Spiroplasma endosymbiont of Labia minor TaxID=3066305 RepID=UPI0030D418B0
MIQDSLRKTEKGLKLKTTKVDDKNERISKKINNDVPKINDIVEKSKAEMIANFEVDEPKKNKIQFLFKLLFLFALCLFLAIDFVIEVFYPVPKYQSLNYVQRSNVMFAFFTTQSNFIVIGLLIYSIFKFKIKNKLPEFKARLAITVYITIAMVVFWIGIATGGDYSEWKWYHWISAVMLHTIIPIVMIVYFLYTSGEQIYNIKKHHTYGLILILVYPLIYIIVMMIRGYLFHRTYLNIINSGEIYSGPPMSTWFPYYFFNYYSFNIGLLVLFILLIVAFGCGLQYLFIYLNNKYYKYLHNEEGKIIIRNQRWYNRKFIKTLKIKKTNK